MQIAHPSFSRGLLLRGAALPHSNYKHVSKTLTLTTNPNVQVAHPSFFVGLLLRGAALPHSNYKHVSKTLTLTTNPNVQVAHPSFFVGLLLRGAALPYSNYGHVVLAQPSPILFYPISSTEVRHTRLVKEPASLGTHRLSGCVSLQCVTLLLCSLRAPECGACVLGRLVNAHSAACVKVDLLCMRPAVTMKHCIAWKSRPSALFSDRTSWQKDLAVLVRRAAQAFPPALSCKAQQPDI